MGLKMKNYSSKLVHRTALESYKSQSRAAVKPDNFAKEVAMCPFSDVCIFVAEK
jgi:hypothetical protein